MAANSVAALTSYTETLPATAPPTKTGVLARAPSALLSPISAKGRRTTKSLFHRGLRRPSAVQSDIAALRTSTNPTTTATSSHLQPTKPGAAAVYSSETPSPALSDSPSTGTAATSGGRTTRSHTGSSVSPNASCSRGSGSGGGALRVDGNPLTPPTTMSTDAAPFVTFTSHLRQRFAISDTGIEVDGNNSLSHNEALSATEGKPAAPLQQLNSARGFGPAPLVPPTALPLSGESALSGLPPLPPTTADISTTSCSILRAASLPDAAVDESDLDAVSRELTALLRGADAALKLLARHQRSLLPDQRRLLSHMHSRSTDQPVSAEVLYEGVQPTHPSSSVNVAEALPKGSSQSAGCLTRSQPTRMMIRPQRNITWE